MTAEGPVGPELNRQLVLESLSKICELRGAPNLDVPGLLHQYATLDMLGVADHPQIRPILLAAGEIDAVRQAAAGNEQLEVLLGLKQPAPAVEAEDGERSRLLEEAERKLIEEAGYLGSGDPMVAFNLWQSESQSAQPLESPESRRGDKQWWQMTQAEFLEKYPEPNIPQTQRAAFALLHRMILEDVLLTYKKPEGWYVDRIPEEVIAEYPDLQGQYEQAKSQVFEQPYEPVPQLSEEAKTKLENIFRQLNEATGSGNDDYNKRKKLTEEAEDQITAILNRPNVRVAVSGIFRRLNDLPLGLDDDFYQGRFKLAQKMFDKAPADLRQVFAISQEAVRVYSDGSPKHHAGHALNRFITRASGVSWDKEKEAASRDRLGRSLRDNFYHGLTGKSYLGYLYNEPEDGRKTPELEVLVQNFQGMNSAEVAYFQLTSSIAQARENYLANLADQVGLKFIPADMSDRWSLVERIGHREISRLIQGKTEQLKGIFTKLEAPQRQADDYSLPRQAMDRARGDAERLKLQLAKALGLSGEENPVTEKTRQEMQIPTFTSWENLEFFMQLGQTDFSNKLFAKASPRIREVFNKARNAFNEEQGGYYEAQSALLDLMQREAGVEEAIKELHEQQRQQAAYESYFNKVLLPRASTVPVDDLTEAFIDANILDNRNLRLQHDIDQRLNDYFDRLAKEAGLPLGFSESKRKDLVGRLFRR